MLISSLVLYGCDIPHSSVQPSVQGGGGNSSESGSQLPEDNNNKPGSGWSDSEEVEFEDYNGAGQEQTLMMIQTREDLTAIADEMGIPRDVDGNLILPEDETLASIMVTEVMEKYVRNQSDPATVQSNVQKLYQIQRIVSKPFTTTKALFDELFALEGYQVKETLQPYMDKFALICDNSIGEPVQDFILRVEELEQEVRDNCSLEDQQWFLSTMTKVKASVAYSQGGGVTTEVNINSEAAGQNIHQRTAVYRPGESQLQQKLTGDTGERIKKAVLFGVSVVIGLAFMVVGVLASPVTGGASAVLVPIGISVITIGVNYWLSPEDYRATYSKRGDEGYLRLHENGKEYRIVVGRLDTNPNHEYGRTEMNRLARLYEENVETPFDVWVTARPDNSDIIVKDIKEYELMETETYTFVLENEDSFWKLKEQAFDDAPEYVHNKYIPGDRIKGEIERIFANKPQSQGIFILFHSRTKTISGKKHHYIVDIVSHSYGYSPPDTPLHSRRMIKLPKGGLFDERTA